jgi:uncharacterized protein YcbK (DUF882 family)
MPNDREGERIGRARDVRRRDLLRLGAFAGALLLPMGALARTISSDKEKTLKLYNLHTGESTASTFWADGRYVSESLREIDKILRDHHTDATIATDRKLVELMFQIQTKLDTAKGLDVVCGYRSAKTNAELVREGRTHARNSYHLRGQALDFRVPDHDLRHVREFAMGLQAGGVGYYPRAGFVHVDVGPVRHW